MTDTITVTFDRIGRMKNPPALQIPFADVAMPEADDFDALWPGDRTNWQVVVELIDDHVRPMIRSSYPEITLTGDLARIHGWIVVGMCGNGGTFTITHPDQENAR
ncbi:hypothetical protein DEU38_13457 [Rhodococcus sp. AG1013]|uniref:hypothetical protein n=1 Tax=Rhodococcus sp. AG1013 TaxID=2183996 RepID=UPI000E0A9E3F|nr:hypothetical protein [Rhodococcus sp. AG1013]RDI13482.1 hypothetical protein DEU38_13457 [Rhodococcus sp. AG1013]